MTKETVLIVEIDQPECTRTYGTAPCTAALVGNNTRKCHNTRATCQDPDNYAAEYKTIRFCRAQEGLEQYGYMIPCVMSASTTPTKINAGGVDRDTKELGTRAVTDIQMMDFKHSDFGFDKYRAERFSGAAQADGAGYDPYNRATLWTKWLARNPYYQNWPLRVKTGFIGDDLSEMTTRHYVLDKITTPANGTLKITAKDILALADDDKAVWPKPTNGELQSAITSSQTSITLNNTHAGEYPTTGGIIRIADEVMTYGSASYLDGVTTLSTVVRAQFNTTASAHDQDEVAQLCEWYQNRESWEVIEHILVNGGNIDPAFINVANEWSDEWNKYQPQYIVTDTLLTEPTGVTTLVAELTQQTASYIWWDERAQKIGYRSVREPDVEPPLWTEYANIIADSISARVKPEQRITQVWVYYQLKSPVLDLDKPSSYQVRRINIDADAGSEDQYGSDRRLVIYSRWIRQDSPISVLAARLLSKYRDPPREITIRVDEKDNAPWTADVIDLRVRNFVNAVGVNQTTRMQIIKAHEIRPGAEYEYVLQTSGLIADVRVGRWMADASPDYATATDEQRRTGFWWANDSGEMSDGSPGYKWQ